MVFQLELRSKEIWIDDIDSHHVNELGQAAQLWLSPATIASSQPDFRNQSVTHLWMKPSQTRCQEVWQTADYMNKPGQDQSNWSAEPHSWTMDLWAISASSLRLSFRVDCRYWKQINIPEFPVTHLYMGLNSALLSNNSFNISVLIEPQSVPYYNIACPRT